MRTEGENQEGCYTRQTSTARRIMVFRFCRISVVLLVFLAFVPLQAATSRQQAEVFAKKIAQIQQQGIADPPTAPRRTPVTQDELNSWFAYRAQPLLPPGISSPQLQIVGQGKLTGEVTVDLETLGKKRSTGGTFDPWSYLGGRVPVTI